jgi:hypothetical protein
MGIVQGSGIGRHPDGGTGLLGGTEVNRQIGKETGVSECRSIGVSVDCFLESPPAGASFEVLSEQFWISRMPLDPFPWLARKIRGFDF